MNDKFVIVTFYTEKYERFLEAWKKSIERFNIPCKAYLCDDTGNWYLNIQNKPRQILRAMNEYQQSDIVWCDVDAELMRYPELLDEMKDDGNKHDIAAFKLSKVINSTRRFIDKHYIWKNYQLYYTGTIYFKNNEKVQNFVRAWLNYLCSDEWVERALSNVTAIGDQDSFNHLLIKHGLMTKDLPEIYCYIERRRADKKYPEDVVFLHYVEGTINSKYVGKRINYANV